MIIDIIKLENFVPKNIAIDSSTINIEMSMLVFGFFDIKVTKFFNTPKSKPSF